MASFPAEHHDLSLPAVPRGRAVARQPRGRDRPQVAPTVRGQVVGPDRRVVQVNLTPPLPAVVAAEEGKADVARPHRIVDILRVATHSRRRGVRLFQIPLPAQRVEGPDLRPLLASPALVVPAVTHQQTVAPIPHAGTLVSQARRRWTTRERAELHPGVGRLAGNRRRRFEREGGCRGENQGDPAKGNGVSGHDERLPGSGSQCDAGGHFPGSRLPISAWYSSPSRRSSIPRRRKVMCSSRGERSVFPSGSSAVLKRAWLVDSP